MRQETRSAPRYALITGASSGLGKALAHFLKQKGFSLILTGRHFEERDPEALTLIADLSTAEGRKSVCKAISTHVPELVINNAGFGFYGNALTIPIADQIQMLEVNAAAVLELSLAAAQALKDRGQSGTILNISSAAAFFIYPSFATYAASKSFVSHFSQALDIELKPHRIRVLTACPGRIATSFQQRAARDFPAPRQWGVMSQETAVYHLWKQISSGKSLYIFDWRYRLLFFLSRLFLLKNRLLSKLDMRSE